MFGRTDTEPFAGRNIADSLPRANLLLKMPLVVPSPFAEPTTRANRTHAWRALWPHDETAHHCLRRSALWHHDALPPTPALPSRRACDDNTALRHSVISVLAPVPRHAIVGHCLLLVDKRRIRVAPPSLQTHFRPTRLPSQPELTRPIFSARSRICSSLSHSDELLIVLLVSTTCYLA